MKNATTATAPAAKAAAAAAAKAAASTADKKRIGNIHGKGCYDLFNRLIILSIHTTGTAPTTQTAS